MDDFILKRKCRHFLLTLLIIALIWGFFWWLGGTNLDEIRILGLEKAKEICGVSSQIVYQGYQRSVFSTFGGMVWYQCERNNILYQFAIGRRINSSEPQVYNFQQITTFPNQFEINK